MDEKTKRNELLITLADVNNLIEKIENEQKYNADILYVIRDTSCNHSTKIIYIIANNIQVNHHLSTKIIAGGK